MNKRKKIIIISIVVVAFLALVILGIYLIKVKTYQDKVANISISSIALDKIVDGEYIGEYNVDFIYAKVAVIMKNGKIEKIHLIEHKNDRGKPAESIIDAMIVNQSIDVDIVASATNSSRVIQKAVENALIK